MTEPLISGDALVLGIETSCDETAVGVVRGGTEILSNVISSQAELHDRFGGVVPEVAARSHTEKMPVVIDQALRDAGVELSDLDAITATQGPGLIGALLVGFATGKAMSAALGVPFSGVHHLEGHLFASVFPPTSVEPPFIALMVSGGHTTLLAVRELGTYEVLGQTLDDAAGEAFDKIGRYLGLGYPGGPAIDKLAKRGDRTAIAFPRAMSGQGLDFSFSGLKTAVVRHCKRLSDDGENLKRADVAASFQEAIVDVQVEKVLRAAEEQRLHSIVLGGGVAANSRLRERLKAEAESRDLRLCIPAPELCVDNGAMIAAAGHFRLRQGEATPMDAAADASLPLCVSAESPRLPGVAGESQRRGAPAPWCRPPQPQPEPYHLNGSRAGRLDDLALLHIEC